MASIPKFQIGDNAFLIHSPDKPLKVVGHILDGDRSGRRYLVQSKDGGRMPVYEEYLVAPPTPVATEPAVSRTPCDKPNESNSPCSQCCSGEAITVVSYEDRVRRESKPFKVRTKPFDVHPLRRDGYADQGMADLVAHRRREKMDEGEAYLRRRLREFKRCPDHGTCDIGWRWKHNTGYAVWACPVIRKF